MTREPRFLFEQHFVFVPKRLFVNGNVLRTLTGRISEAWNGTWVLPLQYRDHLSDRRVGNRPKDTRPL